MLWQRVLTALLLLPAVLGTIWFASTPWVFLGFALVGLLVVWEWTGLMRLPSTAGRWAYVLLTAGALAAAWAARGYWPVLMFIALLWWCVALWLLFGFPANLQAHRPGAWPLGVLGQILVVPTILAIAVLHGMDNGALKLIYTMALIWVADTGAYAAGRLFGRRKLAPRISPGKTWEGVLGGLILALGWALSAGAYVFEAHGMALGLLTALSLLVAIFSIVGDLTESMFKRLVGLKDSGNLLPGHGGILDRVDSLLAALPIMAFGLWLMDLS